MSEESFWVSIKHTKTKLNSVMTISHRQTAKGKSPIGLLGIYLLQVTLRPLQINKIEQMIK